MTRRYLTNMANWQRPIVEEAMGLPSMECFGIDDEPMPDDEGTVYSRVRPNMIGSYFSVWVDPEQECSDFWMVYREIYNSDKWQTWITLCKDDDF